jgi:hypothetical protein
LRISFKYQWMQSALGQVQRRAETGDPAADYHNVIASERSERGNLIVGRFAAELGIASSLRSSQ